MARDAADDAPRIARTLALACAVSLLVALPAPAFAQDDITFTASVDRTAITTDDVLTLLLTLTGTFNSSGQPQLPPLEGFAVVGTSQSSQFSIVNGKTASKVVFTYKLQPTSIGALTIPAIPLQMRGKTYQTEPIAIEVTQGAAPQPQQPSQTAPPDATTPGELAGQDLYAEAEVDISRPVVGQQIIYRFRLYQAVQLFSQARLGWPEFTGFLGQDLSPNNQYQLTASGRQYLVTEVRRALFATRSGEFTIEPTVLVIPGDVFNPQVELETEPVSVRVRPLPKAAPEGFTGAVGQFEIEGWVEPTETQVNEPVTLFVRVAGTGNISLLPDPTRGAEGRLVGWRVYDPEITSEITQDGDAIQGEKLFRRLLVPTAEGELEIPYFELAFFDPAAGTYRQVQTVPLVVSVLPGEAQVPGPIIVGDGKQDVILLGSDIRHIKPAPPAVRVGRTPLLDQPLYWLGWGLPPLLVAGTWLWERRRRSLVRDVAYARAQRARRLGRRRLAEARRLVKGDEHMAYSVVARALTEYLGDKCNLPSAGLTRDVIDQTLTACAVPEPLVARLMACLDWADSGRFAPVAAGRSVHELIAEAEVTMAELDERIGK